MHRATPVLMALLIAGIFLSSPGYGYSELPYNASDTSTVVENYGISIALQAPPEPGRHGITPDETAVPTSAAIPSTPVTEQTTPVPSTTTVPATQTDNGTVLEEPVSPVAPGDVFYPFLAGIILGGIPAIMESRRAQPLPHRGNRRVMFLVYVLIGIGIIGSIFTIQGAGRGWFIIVPILQAALFCTSVALTGGYLSGIRLPYTQLFQGTGSAVLVFIVLLSLVQRGQMLLSPFTIILFGGSSIVSFWQVYSESRAGTASSETTFAVEHSSDPLTWMAEKYTDIDLIAVGGLARVYRARRKKDNALVAVKIPLNTSEVTGTSFMKEILLWQSLSHPNIVSITDASILPVPAVEMEYIPHSLADKKKPLDIPSAVQIVVGIAEGLSYAHEKGVIHRDIKPENILITEQGIPKITDWGMSRILASTMPTVVGFSISYAAPEQVAPSQYGDTDQRTDIFQLGVVFYELVTGVQPFRGEDMGQVISAILHEDLDLPSSLVPAAIIVDPIILKCLEKRPEDRYQSVQEMFADLSAVMREQDQSRGPS